MINQPSFSSVFIHESRGDARHCGLRAGKLSPSRDTTVFTPSKHNGLSRFLVIFSFFFPRHFFNEHSFIRHSISEKDSFSKLLNCRWRQNSKVLSHTSVSLPASPLSPRPLLFLFPIHLTFPLRLPSFHQGSRGMLITERRRYRFEESAVARIFTRPANVNTIYIYIYAPNYALSRRRKNPRKQQFRTMSGTDNRAIITKRGEPRNNKHESFSYHTTNDSYRNDKKAST